MNDKERNNSDLRSRIAMLGTGLQMCNHGAIMSAHTIMNSTAVEGTSGNLLPKVMEADTDQTIQIDRRILAPLDWSALWGQVQISVCAHPQLDLPSDFSPADMIQKWELLRELTSRRKPQLAEELALSIKLACQEAGKNVFLQFDLAVEKAPSKVDAKELADALAQMDRTKTKDGRAMAVFEKRALQFKTLSRLKGQMKEETFEKLKSQLLQIAQGEYLDVLREWAEEHFWEYWKKECEAIRERFEKFLQDSRDYRSKVRLCVEECNDRLDRAKERLTTLKAGNQVVLEEASEAEFLASLMANRKVGGQAELVRDLRHDFDEHLRQLAERRGMGTHAVQQLPFRTLILTLPEADIVDSFISLIIEGTADSHSFYESCQRFGLERLVSELLKRSRITSWFDGRDDPRFGINPFHLLTVRMPEATIPKEIETRDLLKALFQREGVHDILNNSRGRSISVLRIFAGWPIGIEGGNPALLENNQQSANSGHLPHLVGILPDTKAGEHAPGLMRL